MDNESDIRVHIEGLYGNVALTPDNFDTTQLKDLLDVVNRLLSEGRKPKETPVTYHPELGSMVAVFRSNTEIVAKFATVIGLLSTSSIDGLTANTAMAIEDLQKFSVRNGYNINVSTSYSKERLDVTPNTNYYRSTNMYADTELYLYGRIINGGGKRKGTIKLETDNGTFTIEADRKMLEEWEENLLYKEYGVRVTARQHVITGDIEPDTIKLIEILDYKRHVDDAYLQEKMRRATPHWEGVDVDEYLKEIREGVYV